jgi:hypothetical protein
MLLGRIQLIRRNLSEAQVAFAEASRLDPDSLEARALADRLARKLGTVYYAQGLEAFHSKAWIQARELLEKALAQERLGPEHSAIAQQYVVISRFAEARVRQEIAQIQAKRALADQAFTARSISLHDATHYPASHGPGNFVEFQGWVVERSDDPGSGATELIVASRRSAYLSRANFESAAWFAVVTPRPIPDDPRVGAGSVIQVQGRLIDPSSAGLSGRPHGIMRPRVVVMADAIGFSREGPRGHGVAPFFASTPPGLAGPLRIDFLRYTDEQRRNLPPAAP